MEQRPYPEPHDPYRAADRAGDRGAGGLPAERTPQPGAGSPDPYRGAHGPGAPAGPWSAQAPPPAVVVVAGHKSVALAAVLGFCFGPLGMLYSTVLGALVMFVVGLGVAAVTFGFGLVLVWPVCAIWAAVAAGSHNGRLTAAGVRRL